MADEKTLNTRIQLKHGTLAEWQAGKYNKTEYLKAGEVAIVTLGTDVETNHPADGTNTHPVLFKVGTGSHYFDALPWASALAADVYDWAKKPSLDANDLPNIPGAKFGLTVTVTGTGNAITAASWDATSKTITLTKGETFATKQELEDVIAAAISIKAGALIDVEQNGTEYTVKHETVANPTETAGTGRKYLTGVTTDGYGHITGFTTASEVDQDLSNYKTKQTAVAEKGAEDKTLKISQNANGEISVEEVDIKLTNINQLPDLTEFITGTKVANAGHADAADVATKVSKALTIGSKSFDGSAAVEITATDLGLESAMHFVGAYPEAPADAKNGDVYLNTATKKEYVYSDGWVELGDEGSYALRTITITGTDGLVGGGDLTTNRTISLSDDTKASLAKADTALQANDIAGKADKVTGATNGNFAGLDANGNLTDSGKNTDSFDAKGTAANLIADLDVNDITGFGAGKTLATLIETDGKIAATFQDIAITESQITDL